jgi:hypothetical protein
MFGFTLPSQYLDNLKVLQRRRNTSGIVRTKDKEGNPMYARFTLADAFDANSCPEPSLLMQVKPFWLARLTCFPSMLVLHFSEITSHLLQEWAEEDRCTSTYPWACGR